MNTPGSKPGGPKPGGPKRPKYRRRGLRNLLLGGRCLDLGGDHRDTTFLAGSARSGTTWASDVLNPGGGMRYIFEPFRPGEFPAFRGLSQRPYLRPEDPHPEYTVPVGVVLRGESRGRWSDRHNGCLISNRRLVKEVRANLMLGWLRERFPEMGAILLLRHPCAVVESRLRLGWRVGLEDFTRQRQLLEDYPEPLKTLLPSVEDDFERGILAWCVENYVPLSGLRTEARGVHVVRYEDLLLGPEKELDRLPARVREGVGDPARTAGRTVKLPREELALGWRSRVGGDLQARARKLLGAFGLDVLYSQDGLPTPDGIEEFLSGPRVP